MSPGGPPLHDAPVASATGADVKRTTPRSRRRTAIGSAGILPGMLWSMVGLGTELVDASTRVAAPVPYNGNLDCADFGFAYEFKIDEQPTAKTYNIGDPKVVT